MANNNREDFLKTHNILGQRKRRFTLGRDQREVLCEGIERAVNRGESEVRVYWEEDLKRMWVIGVGFGDKTRVI